MKTRILFFMFSFSLLCFGQGVELDSLVWEEIREDISYEETAKRDTTTQKIEASDFEFNPPSPDLDLSFLKPFLFIFIILAILVVLFFLFKQPGGKRFDPVLVEAESLEEAEENLPEVALNRLLKRYEDAGDLKRSLRIKFLMLLQEMIFNEKVVWHPSKTNQTYVREFRKHRQGKAFAQVVNGFDPIWYGNHELTQEGYHEILAKINQVKLGLNE